MSLRAMVLGGTGMLGRALAAEGRRRRGAVLALSHAQAEVTQRPALRYWMEAFRPEVVFNCAAFTKVDDCEHNPATAFAVNELGAMLAAEEAAKVGARLVQLSSDYVFDGKATSPYREDAPTAPISVYGESKLAGEQRVLRHEGSLVVRTSWLFGEGGPNFVATMLRLLAADEAPRVVDDQIGGPTYTPFLARALWDLAVGKATGIVGYQNQPAVSWYGFATEIARLASPRREIVAIPTAELPRPARRPSYSVLDVSRFESLAGRRVESWSWGLAEYLRAQGERARIQGGF